MQRLSQFSIFGVLLLSLLLVDDASNGIAGKINHDNPRPKTSSNPEPLNSTDETAPQSPPLPPKLFTNLNKRIKKLIGSRDAAILTFPSGKPILSVYADRLLIPASTLKIVTALVALHHLGPEYRFSTDFYIDAKQNLKVKGFGDPLLVSENLKEIALKLTRQVAVINDIIIDDSYFETTIAVPGKNNSLQPYDAPNGAFCVNFNTVAFKKINATYVSDEDQTPLLPFALSKVKSSGLSRGRIMLAEDRDDSIQYAGELLNYFLGQSGIKMTGKIRRGTIQPDSDQLLLHHLSPETLEQIILRLMEHSNNFIANQLFLTAGATMLGAPATLVKGIQVTKTYAENHIGLKEMMIVEGSGLSRKNRMSASAMIEFLKHFAPYYYLLRYKNKEYYKTGTLSDVKSRAGYLQADDGQRYPFAVLINTPGKSTKTVMHFFRNTIAGIRKASLKKTNHSAINR